MSSPSTSDAHRDSLYRLLVNSVTDCAIYMLDPSGVIASWNAGAERAKGYTASEIVGQHFSRFYTAEDRTAGLPERALEAAVMLGRFEGEGWRVRRDGSQFWARAVIEPIRDEESTLIGFAKITRDLTEHKRQADAIRETSAKLEIALSHMSQGLVLYDKDERLVLCNDRYRHLLGLSASAAQPGVTFREVIRSVLRPAFLPGDEVALETQVEQVHQTQVTARLGQGSAVAELRLHGRTISVSHGLLPIGGWVATLDDVTEQRQSAARMTHLAHHDPLTGLNNRLTFQDLLAATLSRAVEKGALLFLDLDRFKPVNDSLGHEAGDALLKVVADRIRNHLRESDVAARLGGDEFAVLLADCISPDDAASVAERLIQEIAGPVAVKGLNVSVGSSIGIAMISPTMCEPDDLLHHADLALYRAKEAGRNCYRFYEPAMEEEAQSRRELEIALRQALANQEFELHFQPVVDTNCRLLTGFEALLRWQSPSRGRVPPADFVPFAEEIGLMPDIGEWVLRTACREAAGWPDHLKVSVNLSPKQFMLPALVERVSGILAESGLEADRLELEITETAMIDDIEGAAAILGRLRRLGVHVALDDFGTGCSSLSFLRNLPFTRIKIDRSFVHDLGETPEAAAIVRAVTSLCSSLGVTATAEGVESERQVAILQKEGCPEMQGFLICRPCPAHDLPDLIAHFSDRTPSDASGAKTDLSELVLIT